MRLQQRLRMRGAASGARAAGGKARLASVLALAAAAVAAAAAPPTAVRIMPLGDSITEWGCGVVAGTDPAFNRTSYGGYRSFLGDAIAGSRLATWSFVGSMYTCGQHEGHSGITAAELLALLPRVLPAFAPDIILLQAGTNDLFNFGNNSRGANVTVTAQRLSALVSATLAALPGARVLVSGVTQINATRCALYPQAPWHPPPCPPQMPQMIDALNTLLPSVLAPFGSAVAFHDVNSEAAFVADDFWQWGIHFTESGFAKIGASWWKHLEPVLREWAGAGL